MSVYADLVSPVAKYASIVQHVLRLPRFSTPGVNPFVAVPFNVTS